MVDGRKSRSTLRKTRKKKIKNVGYKRVFTLTKSSKKSKKNNKGKSNNSIINPPLAKDKIMGTAETLGNMNYFYQKYSNIYEFFSYIINHNKVTGEYKMEDLCMPNFGNISFGTFAALQFDLDKEYSSNNPCPSDYKVSLSESLNSINKCLNSPDRFVVMSYQIVSDKYTISHANSILFDTKKKIVELFEPHGALTESTTMNGYVGAYKQIDKNLEIFIKKNFSKYKYVSPQAYLPSYGLQVKVDAYNGLCVTWNILYIHYKLLNPNISSKDLIKHINKYVKLDVILKYAKEVKYMLKLGKEYKLKSHFKADKSNQQKIKSTNNSKSTIKYKYVNNSNKNSVISGVKPFIL